MPLRGPGACLVRKCSNKTHPARCQAPDPDRHDDYFSPPQQRAVQMTGQHRKGIGLFGIDDQDTVQQSDPVAQVLEDGGSCRRRGQDTRLVVRFTRPWIQVTRAAGFCREGILSVIMPGASRL